MVQIRTDSATLFTVEEGKELEIEVLPQLLVQRLFVIHSVLQFQYIEK